MTTGKPFESYFGGKEAAGTFHKIINQIPPHRVYVEPFVGGGAIFRQKLPATLTVLADTDPAVVDRWVSMAGIRERSYAKLEDSDAGAQIFLADAILLLSEQKVWFNRKDTFIYVDPPYPHSTRSSSTRYSYELDEAQHQRLLTVLDTYYHAKIAISTYPNEQYAEVLKDWRYIEFQSTTRGGPRTERLYMNYDDPTELHDYRYVGEGYRERERIAKKVRRHVKKLASLPDLERKAILNALLQHP